MAASASCPPASPWRRTPLAASPVGAAATAPIDAGTAGASGLDSYRRSKKPGAIKRVVPSARPPLAKRFFRISRHSSIAKRASHPSIALGPRCCSPCLWPFRARNRRRSKSGFFVFSHTASDRSRRRANPHRDDAFEPQTAGISKDGSAIAGAKSRTRIVMPRPLLRARRNRTRIASVSHAGSCGRRFAGRWLLEQLRIDFLQLAEFGVG
jgi:hypothetical protein